MTLFGLGPVAPLYWHLPVMIVVISLIYSATRYDEWGSILHEAWRYGLRMAGFLLGVGAAVYLVAVFLVPRG